MNLQYHIIQLCKWGKCKQSYITTLINLSLWSWPFTWRRMHEQTQPTFPSVVSRICCHMVQLSSVATRFSVNLCKCGLDPQGRDSLASTPAMDQQAFPMCTHWIGFNWKETGASVDLHCRDKFRKGHAGYPTPREYKNAKYSTIYHRMFYVIEFHWSWMQPRRPTGPQLAPDWPLTGTMAS